MDEMIRDSWISTDARLPTQEEGFVLAHVDFREPGAKAAIRMAYYEPRDGLWRSQYGRFRPEWCVTHWIPLRLAAAAPALVEALEQIILRVDLAIGEETPQEFVDWFEDLLGDEIDEARRVVNMALDEREGEPCLRDDTGSR